MTNKRKWQIAQISVIVFLLIGFVWELLPAYTLDAFRDAEIIAEVRHIIQKNYIEDISSQKLLEGSLQGMVSVLDEYSEYLDEEDYRKLAEGTEGKFVGIGIEITQENKILTVIAPIEDSPAAKAGILAGDKIIAIDRKSSEGMSVSEAVKILRGDKGDRVMLTVIHEGSKVSEDITVVRDTINIESIKDCSMVDQEHGIGYLRLVKFNNNTSEKLREKIDWLSAQGMKSLILDLRFNPGGVLQSAVDVVNCFLKEGVIVYTKGKTSKSRTIFRATPENTYDKLTLAVLVNKSSASASEIVAGALQDHHRAVIVGAKTYGKGMVQSIITLRDEKTAVKLTTAHYYTPAGRNIQRDERDSEGGIEPDILSPMSLEEERWLELWLRRPDKRKENNFEDRQLQKALEIIKNSAR